MTLVPPSSETAPILKRLLGRAQRWLKRRALRVLNGAQTWVGSWGRLERLTDTPELLVLAPQYEADKHALYVDLIEDALTKPESGVFNIALTGGYGVGKSSILSEVTRRHRDDVIAISLSTLGFADDEPQPSSDVAKAASTKTNRIQKEIVKQLLYSVRPGKMPGSGYRRATKLPFWRMAGYASFIGVVIGAVFLLTGWGVHGATLLGVQADTWVVTVAIAIVAAIAAFPFLTLFHYRLQLNGVEAGGATISLSTKSATYFDEYLDEIVYFFEVVDRDIIIFEDIDRFNDPHIFETLRSLNSILNNAKQLGGRRIRFIYAIKDSIFDRLGDRAAKAGKKSSRISRHFESDSEAARANRTKFFDVVIPVVPFITHRSARGLLDNTLGQLKTDDLKNVIDVAAKHLADMRLIKNIRNEYVVFKAQVLDASKLDLKPDRLLAMVLYKSTHLGDFELIKLGDSNLDNLYRASRDLVETSLTDIETKLRDARRRRRQTTMAAERAKIFGDALVKYVERVLRHAPTALGQLSLRDWTLDGTAISSAELRGTNFWHSYAESAGPLIITVQRSNGGTLEFRFTREDVTTALRTRIDPAEVIAAEREQLDGVIAELESDRSDLSKADMAELVRISKYKLTVGEASLTFDELVERHLKSPLSRDLLRGGFLDRNFTLYTSPFFDTRLSAEATNFVMKNVNRNSEESHFELSAEDVQSLINELGYPFLDGPAGRNIHVADYLLTSDQVGAARLVTSLLNSAQDGTSFILTYLETGKVPEKLIEALTPSWQSVIGFLVIEANVADDLRLRLLNTAMSTLASDIEYDVSDEDVGVEISRSYDVMTVFISENTSSVQAETVATVAKNAGAEIADLQPLSVNMRRAVVGQGIYPLDRRNLVSALDGKEDLSLDAIEHTEAVYNHVLANMGAYLGLLEDEDSTVVNSDAFPRIIGHVMAAAPDQLEAVASRAADGCLVADLEDLDDNAAASVLARLGRIEPTFHNITAYLAWSDAVDEDLVIFLNGIEAVTGVDDAEEADKESLALQIIGSNAISAVKRAVLVKSLQLEDYLDVDQIAPGNGDLYSELVAHDLIHDDAESYARLSNSGWEARQAYISKSSRFQTYVTPELIGTDLAKVLNSSAIGVPVKSAILMDADFYAQESDGAALVALAARAASDGAPVTVSTVLKFAQANVAVGTVFSLLRPSLSAARLDEIAPILIVIGGEYAKLAGRTGKHPRITKTADAEALVARLAALGLVASSTSDGARLRVNMRRAA